jgi:carbonic anhydrase
MPAPAAPEHAAWGYDGPAGPAAWGDLKPEFAACKSGQSQTPIDVDAKKAPDKTLTPLRFQYGKLPLLELNNGHTIEVENSVKAVLEGAGEAWQLVQFHFHTPSEHTVNGKSFPLELHLVHKNDKGSLAVVAMLFEAGPANQALAAVFDNAPTEVTAEPRPVPGAMIDLGSLMPKQAAYTTYPGSLTTPPCSENVTWFVLDAAGQASTAQIAKLQQLMHGHNNRPLQALGTRQPRHYR